MQITVKLYASLTDYLPAGAAQNKIEVDVAEATTVGAIVHSLNLPPKLVHLVLVNGHYIAPAARAGHALRAGDALAIWPPVAGG
jgi:sulfur carrier protein ThiS